MDKKLNNLIGIEEFSCEKICKKTKTTKRTDVAKDILEANNEYPKDWGKNITEKPKTKDAIVNGKLNNLISLDDFGNKSLPKNDQKHTKRTEVGKDIINEENDYPKDWSKPITEKPSKKDIISNGKFNNLIAIDDFGTKSLPKNDQKHTKRTEVGKDVILEKAKSKKAKQDNKDDKKGEKKECKTGLSAAQKKLPAGLQAAILKKQGKCK